MNVVTGHPYEPQLAVSGIDHTVKIFSPDQAAQAEFLNQEPIQGPSNGEENDYGVGFDHGERSRRRLQHQDTIRRQNNSLRDTGVQEALVTVGDAFRILSTCNYLAKAMVASYRFFIRVGSSHRTTLLTLRITADLA